MPPLFTRNDAPQIVVNVPAPIVNVNIDDGPSVNHQDVKLIRNRRTGELEGATVDGYDEPPRSGHTDRVQDRRQHRRPCRPVTSQQARAKFDHKAVGDDDPFG